MAILEPTTALDSVACAHCGTPVPDAPAKGGDAFCCSGCATVHRLLRSANLLGFYRLAGDAVLPAQTTGRAYGEFDDPTFRELHARAGGDGTSSIVLYLEGVHCAGCLYLVEALPRLCPGVLSSRLDLSQRTAEVRWDPAQVELSAVARQLDALGYPPHPARGSALREARRAEDRALLSQVAIAGALAANVMGIALALYSGVFAGMDARTAQFFRWVSLGLTVPAVFGPGSVFLRGAWSSLRTRVPHMDLPVAVALLAGLGWGAWNTLRGTGEVYFDTVAVLVFLLLVGRYLLQRQQRVALDASELLTSLAPQRARRLAGEAVTEVPVEVLAPGDVVEVRTGETFPVDGAIVRGDSQVDRSLLSGESRPVDVAPGDPVQAGTTNLNAPLHVRVESAGEATRVGRLLQQVQDSARRKAPLVEATQRIASVFVAAVLLLAGLTLALWLPRGADVALDHAVALLIVTCPCALGLATPLAVSVALGRAARRGVLVKGGDALQRLSRPGRLILDKTGTLTLGEQRLLRWIGDEEIQPAVAALEAGSGHSLARALVDALPSGSELAVERRRELPGGVEGVVGGRRLRVGSPRYVLNDEPAPAWVTEALDLVLANAWTPVLVEVEGGIVAVAACGDSPRPEAEGVLERLRARGWQIEVLSGDHPRVVDAVGAQLGIRQRRGGVTPEEKLAYVEAAVAESAGLPVVMVGDGANDAGALAAADVGVGVHGGSEAALEAGDVYLRTPGLTGLDELLSTADRTFRAIRRSVAISLAYNLIAASLAIAGLISPLVAAILMPLSSLSVVASSARAGR